MPHKIKKVMHERKKGTLRSSSGAKVTDPKQALAIGLSEDREAHGKPQRRRASPKRKSRFGVEI